MSRYIHGNNNLDSESLKERKNQSETLSQGAVFRSIVTCQSITRHLH